MIYIAIVDGNEEDCCVFDSEEGRTKAIIHFIKMTLSDIKNQSSHRSIVDRFAKLQKKFSRTKRFLDYWNDYWQEDIEEGKMPSVSLYEEEDEEEEVLDERELAECRRIFKTNYKMHRKEGIFFPI